MSKPRRKVTDTERLDFMEKHEFQAEKDSSPVAGNEKWIVGDEGTWSPTLRQAIDAAIAASAKKGGRKP